MAISTINQAGLTAPLTLTAPVINTVTSAASTALTLQSAGTTAVTIDTSQNVGIGTSSPAGYKLNVNGTSNFSGAINLTAASSVQWNGGDAAIVNSGTNLLFKTYNGSSLAEQARIDSSGNLLVGTTSAKNGSLLTVNGTGITSTFSGYNNTVTTTVSVGAGQGGAMCLIRGVNGSGVSYSSLFLLAIKQSGGAAPDLASTLISNVGSVSPTFTFSSSGGFITVQNASSVTFNISFIGL